MHTLRVQNLDLLRKLGISSCTPIYIPLGINVPITAMAYIQECIFFLPCMANFNHLYSKAIQKPQHIFLSPSKPNCTSNHRPPSSSWSFTTPSISQAFKPVWTLDPLKTWLCALCSCFFTRNGEKVPQNS